MEANPLSSKNRNIKTVFLIEYEIKQNILHKWYFSYAVTKWKFENSLATYFHAFFAGLDLCDVYDISAEVLVEKWVAFMVEKNIGLEPTLKSLDQLEHSILKKPNKNDAKSSTTRGEASMLLSVSPRLNQNNEYPLVARRIKDPSSRRLKAKHHDLLATICNKVAVMG